jgi:hypothetical protein
LRLISAFAVGESAFALIERTSADDQLGLSRAAELLIHRPSSCERSDLLAGGGELCGARC